DGGTAANGTQAGANWLQINAAMPVTWTASALDGDGAVLLANQSGFVSRLQAGVLVPVNKTALPSLSGLLPNRDRGVLALGVAGIRHVQAAGAMPDGVAKSAAMGVAK
ncbi:MAG: hypothetical protein V4772_16640, partial [Pseudomonadota bacterium]